MNSQTTSAARSAYLGPGQRRILGESNGYRVVEERACNGKVVRVVRESADGFEVIQTRTVAS